MKKVLFRICRVGIAAAVLAMLLGIPTPVNAKITYTKDKFELTGGSSNSYVRFTNTNSIFFKNTVVKQYENLGTQKSSPAPAVDTGVGSLIGGGTGTAQYKDVTLSINLSGQYPAVYGNDNVIKFYSPGFKTYNSLYGAGFYTLSDQRSKQDIADLDLGLNSILQLRPVTFHWVEAPDSTASVDSDVVYGPNSEELQIGFLAQEVEEILPDVVSTDPEGNKAINYTSMIPVLVKSIQELQAQVQEQNAIIDNLKSQNAALANEQGDRITNCTPNPTKGEITIHYQVSEDVNSVRILITNLIGTAVAMEECSVTDKSVTFNLAGQTSGLYLATLICNGDVKDSKQIVVSR